MKWLASSLILLVCSMGRIAVAADIKVACVGDSITAGSGATSAATNYPAVLGTLLGTGWNVRNFGNSGKTMIKKPSDGASYWDQTEFTQSQSFQPDVVIIMLGTNDSKTSNWKSGNNTYAADYKSMVAVYLALLSKPKVYAMFPPPALSSQYNISATVIQNEIIPIIKSVANQAGVETLDLNTPFSANNPTAMMGSDGIHPNDTGYRFIAQFVAAALKVAPTDAAVADRPVVDAGGQTDGPSADRIQPADGGGNTDLSQDSGLGGTTGTGGFGSGGATGTGGSGGVDAMPGSGGTNNTGGTVATGGSSASGGDHSSTGGAGTGGAGTGGAGTGGSSRGPNGSSNAGCGCQVPSSGVSSVTDLLYLAAMVIGIRRSRQMRSVLFDR